MDFVEFIGSCAAFCTTFSFLPQVVRVWRTKSTNDISLMMYIVLCSGLLLWLLYGVLLGSRPLILANAITLFLASIVLFFKIKLMNYKR